MKKLLLLFIIAFIGLSGKIEPRFNLYTLSWYNGRPHTGICLENRTLSEIFSTLYDMTDPNGTLPPEKEAMYWKIYNSKRYFACGEWKKGMKPISWCYTPICMNIKSHHKYRKYRK